LANTLAYYNMANLTTLSIMAFRILINKTLLSA
jgi:hypothetical protein